MGPKGVRFVSLYLDEQSVANGCSLIHIANSRPGVKIGFKMRVKKRVKTAVTSS